MTALFDWQVPASERHLASIRKHGVTADGSDTGVGKTYIVCSVARSLQKPLVVLCPKSIIPEWERVAELFGVPIDVVNYEKVRTGKTPYGKWQVKGRVFSWEIRSDAVLVFDEAHRCGGMQTQNASLLIAAKRQRIPLILASATLIASPLKGYALGYALGLHNLTNYWPWARQQGVTEGYFGPEWTPSDAEEIMQQIRATLGDKFTRIRKAQVPGFPQNQVIPTFVQTKEIPEETTEGEEPSEYGVDARQAVELLKVPGLVEKTKELVEDEGMSVAIFVNFRATLAALLVAFPDAVAVFGGQTSEERQEAINSFQQNRSHVILLMSQAGGVGVSLHDLNGRPRAALICPGYDAVEFLQVLGRIHRAGSLSPAINYIIFASGVSVERRIRARLEAKLTNLTALNDYDLNAHQPQSDSSTTTQSSDRTLDNTIATHAHESNRPENYQSGQASPLPSVNGHGPAIRAAGSGAPSVSGHEGGLGMSKRAKIIPGAIEVVATVINSDAPPAAQVVAAASDAAVGAHINRKHARCSPSKLKNLEICPSYEGDESGTPHPVTLRGTAMHEALETGNDSALIEGEAELVAMCREYLAEEIDWAESVTAEPHLKTHDRDVQGFLDLLLVGPTETREFEGKPKAFRRAKMRDFKMGWNAVDLPNINPQAIAYVVGGFIADPLIEEINFAFLIPRLDAVLEHTFYRSELPDLKLRLSTIAERVRTLAGKEFNVVADNCLYCGRKATCAALHAKVLTIANAQPPEERLPLPATFNPDTITEPDQLALALNLAHIAEDWAQKIKSFALRYRLELGQEIPGYDLIERQAKRAVSDVAAAYAVAKEFGVTELEFLNAATMSIVALETAVREHAADGDKAHAAERFTDRLMDVNAINRGIPFHVLQKSRKKARPSPPSTLTIAPAA